LLAKSTKHDFDEDELEMLTRRLVKFSYRGLERAFARLVDECHFWPSVPEILERIPAVLPTRPQVIWWDFATCLAEGVKPPFTCGCGRCRPHDWCAFRECKNHLTDARTHRPTLGVPGEDQHCEGHVDENMRLADMQAPVRAPRELRYWEQRAEFFLGRGRDGFVALAQEMAGSGHVIGKAALKLAAATKPDKSGQ
jgi:hypothetical protein